MALRELRKHFVTDAFPVPDENGRIHWSGPMNIGSLGGSIKQIMVKPFNSDTIYSMGIRDESGMLMWAEFDYEGEYFAQDLDLILFPGIKTFILDDASSSEPFTVKIVWKV